MQTYLTDLVFSSDTDTIEDVREKTQQLIEFAESRDMKLIDGSTHIARERDAVETLAYSVGAVFRNQTALKKVKATA